MMRRKKKINKTTVAAAASSSSSITIKESISNEVSAPATVSANPIIPHRREHHTHIYEGESLIRLLESIEREIESATLLNKALPRKFWLKQQFSIGVNEVTRVLERMHPVAAATDGKAPPLDDEQPCLQAILVATDCNPRWLTKHIPILASLRNVPLIFVKDKKKGASLRLGELVKLKAAIAIGVKARGNAVNQLIEEILCGNEVHGTDA